jgi:glycosyltransferase involved in cell wall biosynthesis
LVVDGGSTDGSIEIVDRVKAANLQQVLLHDSTESEGQIEGVNRSDGEVIMFTNSDIYVPGNWIGRHVEWLKAGYDVVGGKVFWGGDRFAFTWNMPRPKGPRHVQEEGLGLGFSNFSTTKEFYNRVGGVRRMNSQQDTEFSFRAFKHGAKIILDPEIEVYHDHPFKSFRGTFVRSFGYGQNHALVMRATYGRIVNGSGAPARMPIGYIANELAGITGVRAYQEHMPKARSRGIDIGLPRFLFIRLFSTKLGQFTGILMGAARRNVDLGDVGNLHVQR